MQHRPQVGEPFRDPRFDNVFQVHHAQDLGGLGDQQRGAAVAGDLVGRGQRLRRHGAPVVRDPLGYRGHRALADGPDVTGLRQVDAAHPGAGRELDDLTVLRGVAGPVPVDVVFVPAEFDDGLPFRGVVGQARGQRRGRQDVGVDARRGDQPGGLPVAVGDGAGLVQQQGGHVTGGLHGAPAHRQHVVLHQPVHAGHPDGGDQRADGGGDQAHQQADQDDDGLR